MFVSSGVSVLVGDGAFCGEGGGRMLWWGSAAATRNHYPIPSTIPGAAPICPWGGGHYTSVHLTPPL